MPIVVTGPQDASTLTLADLRSELYERGFHYLPVARANRFLNDAYHEIQEYADWPWLVDTTSGTAPLNISDVREVLYVLDTVNLTKLPSVDIRDVTDRTTDLITAGTPSLWWFDGDTLTVYPPNVSSNFSVRYLKVPSDLSDESDVPLLPSRYHLLIVELATAVAYRDRDNFVASQACRQEVDYRLQRMMSTHLNRESDNAQFITVTGASSDW